MAQRTREGGSEQFDVCHCNTLLRVCAFPRSSPLPAAAPAPAAAVTVAVVPAAAPPLVSTSASSLPPFPLFALLFL